jgi:hypothetical protein
LAGLRIDPMDSVDKEEKEFLAQEIHKLYEKYNELVGEY